MHLSIFLFFPFFINYSYFSNLCWLFLFFLGGGTEGKLHVRWTSYSPLPPPEIFTKIDLVIPAELFTNAILGVEQDFLKAFLVRSDSF